VLREVAHRLSASVRTVDRVARLGGEEFGLILMQTDADGGFEVANRVCASMRSESVKISETLTLAVTVSAGVAELAPTARTAAALVAAADKALYAAKAAGRDRACWA
jgi:diguanylate cyclase (GGDEF)-like protein